MRPPRRHAQQVPVTSTARLGDFMVCTSIYAWSLTPDRTDDDRWQSDRSPMRRLPRDRIPNSDAEDRKPMPPPPIPPRCCAYLSNLGRTRLPCAVKPIRATAVSCRCVKVMADSSGQYSCQSIDQDRWLATVNIVACRSARCTSLLALARTWCDAGALRRRCRYASSPSLLTRQLMPPWAVKVDCVYSRSRKCTRLMPGSS